MTKRNAGKPGAAGRREFLKGMLVTGGAAAIAAATGKVSAAVATAAPATPAAAPKGYHLTGHIAEYYRTAQL